MIIETAVASMALKKQTRQVRKCLSIQVGSKVRLKNAKQMLQL